MRASAEFFFCGFAFGGVCFAQRGGEKSKMRPILLKGHERPLTFLKYNRDGDLLFSCAKDHTPTVWYASNGERLGTYKGHNGAVWCCDVSSKCLLPCWC